MFETIKMFAGFIFCLAMIYVCYHQKDKFGNKMIMSALFFLGGALLFLGQFIGLLGG